MISAEICKTIYQIGVVIAALGGFVFGMAVGAFLVSRKS